MQPFDYEYLIVGQGIGGTSVAWHLHDSGKSFQIVGDSSMPSSSRVAAGIFNPLTGKKLVKTWLADDLFPYARTFYGGLEEKLGQQIMHLTPIYRPFRSIEEQNTYLAQTADPGISPYVAARPDPGPQIPYINADFGGLEVIQAGWIDLPALLDASRTFFLKQHLYREATFHPADLSRTDDGISWQGKRFKKVIFSQGFFAMQNEWFNWLPFTPVKGQILEIATDVPLKPYIINQGIFALPLSENRMKVGATYSWDPLDWAATEAATDELESKLRTMLNAGYTLAGAQAGIRPSVRDRRPLIGIHPEFANVCIFNGLGTKGVTLAPFLAKEFCNHLIYGKELNPLVNIKRYFSLYFR
ncbi:FAD-dependent oxidoreductase [Dyadobacter beijingensis]|uniref:FAD-dependent oxidoreductase n=1 Tax=Dyadobacter beijingensis TaxID=365489 RepID=A0ABQ2HQL2_9BACT|nr:FAD-binding oxidoreductase [Dyadobacter beijingensis]GGM85561.1 FAD-dependent oxidoreductase [Dyadobacter beijingensis]